MHQRSFTDPRATFVSSSDYGQFNNKLSELIQQGVTTKFMQRLICLHVNKLLYQSPGESPNCQLIQEALIGNLVDKNIPFFS